MSFELPKLPYAFDALEPHIDARTMEIHHGKHHQGYTNNLNSAIQGTELEGKSIEYILNNLDMTNAAVRNNGGGFYNHCLFWEVMSPKGGGEPSGDLAIAINDAFFVATRYLGRRVFDQSLRRLQPARARPIAPALAGCRAMLVVVPTDGVPALRLQRLFDDQPCRQLHQLGPSVRRGQAAFNQIRKRLARMHRARYSLRHGVSPCWRRRQPALVCKSSARMHPYQIFQQV